MTNEEAGEIILKGPIWSTCTAEGCENGWVNASTGQLLMCECCLGYGRTLHGPYIKACAILGMPKPMPPWRRINVQF